MTTQEGLRTPDGESSVRSPSSGGARLREVLVVLAAALGLAMPATVATGAEQRAVAGPGGFSLGYLTPTITVAKGDSIVFTNLDIFEHDFVHDTETDGFGGKRNVAWCKRAAGHEHDHGGACPIFWSELIGSGQDTEVLGLNRVKPGKTYSFFCTEHHNMKGKLVITR